jgi:K+:H+ antiporter
MTDQEVQLFLADLAIIVLLARLLGMAAKRLGQPPVLGEIIAGQHRRGPAGEGPA